MAGGRAVLDLTDATWNDHVPQAGRPALVQVWAPWSVACRQQTQIVDRLAEHFGPHAQFFRISIDDGQEIFLQLRPNNVPYVFVFRRGEVVFRAVGFQSESRLQRVLYRLVE